LTTAADGKLYKTKNYNLDVVISVGYRVKSKRGTEFRIWANKLLKEFLVKGFVLNEKRLKEQSQMQLMELQRTVKLIQVDKTTANNTFFIALILNKLIAMNKPKILPLPPDKSGSHQLSNLKNNLLFRKSIGTFKLKQFYLKISCGMPKKHKWSMLTGYWLLLTGHCLLLTANCLLLTAYCLLQTANC
jgi:Virulence protein RhuM family